jgi:replicative DNA helicase
MEPDPQDTVAERGRVPPNDSDLERSLLGALLMSKEAMDAVAGILRSEHFYGKSHQRIYSILSDMYQDGKAWGEITDIATELRARDWLQSIGGASYLAVLMNETPALSDARMVEYATRIIGFWRVRKMIACGQRIAAEGYGVRDDFDKYIEECDKQVFQISQTTPAKDSLHTMRESVKTLFEEVQAGLKLKESDTMTCPTTGFTELDKKLGGLQLGTLTIIGARPSMGKTAVAVCMGANCLKSKSVPKFGVLMCSAETKHQRIAARIISAAELVELAKFRTLAFTHGDMDKLTKGAGDATKLAWITDDASAPSMSHVRSAVRRAETMLKRVDEAGNTTQRLGLVVIDFLQLFVPDVMNRGATREQAVSEVARSLHQIAKDHDVAVLALSQLNRAVELRADKRPTLSDLRDSGEIEQAAETVILVYRDEYYNKESKDQGIAELIVAKSKDTALGVVRCRFRGEYTRFDNLEEQEPD